MGYGWLKISICLMAFFCLPSVAGALPQKFTLESALVRALEENRDIEVARERLAEFKGLKGEALSGGLPQLTGTGQYLRTWKKPQMSINGMTFVIGRKNTYTTSANVSQLIWDGGKVIHAVKGAKSELNSGIQNIKDAEQQVRLQVKETFYQVLYVDKVIGVLEKQLKQLKSHLSSIRTRFKQGLESDYTLMRQEVEVINLEPQLTDAQQMREFLLNSLKILLVVDPSEDIVLEGSLEYFPGEASPVEELVERSKNDRPDLQAAKYHQDALRHGVGVEKSGYWPTLNFNTALNWTAQSDGWGMPARERKDSLLSTVNLTWPIFEGLKTRSRVKQARSKYFQQSFLTSKLKDTVVKEVEDAHLALTEAKQNYITMQKALNLAKRSTEIASERFSAGLMSQLELFDTINAEAQAEQQYYKAIMDCLVATAGLEKAVGGNL